MGQDPGTFLPTEQVARMGPEMFRILLQVDSSLDIPASTDSLADVVVRHSRLPCVLVALEDAGRRALVGGAGIPEALRQDWTTGGFPLPERLPADDGAIWWRLALRTARLDDGGILHLSAYGPHGERAEAADAWLELAMPAFFLAVRNARFGLHWVHSSVGLEAEVERRTREISRLTASERELLAQLQEQTVQLQVANAELRQLDQLKTSIISGVSHELRTPLSTIRTILHLLRRHTVPPERFQHYLNVLDAQVERQMQLVDDLLSLARLDAGDTPLERTAVDLAGIVADVAERQRPAIEAAGQTLAVDLPPDGPVTLMAHPSEIEQVVGNLLGNAHKFTPAGGHIEVVLSASGDGIRLVVRDSGCGIAPEHQARIFERFYRVPDTASRVQGTGLGLAITQRLVASLGGAISLESAVGTGSTFTVTWPQRGGNDGFHSSR